MLLCEYCGAKNHDEELDCRKCGAPLPIAEKESVIPDYPLLVGERGSELFIPRPNTDNKTEPMWWTSISFSGGNTTQVANATENILTTATAYA